MTRDVLKEFKYVVQLLVASTNGHAEIIKLVLEPEGKSNPMADVGGKVCTPLSIAKQQERRDTIRRETHHVSK